MSAPTAPTLATLTAEGIKKAGYSSSGSQYASLLTRAQDEWMNEIKMDIMSVEKRLKLLMVTKYQVTVNALAVYDYPSDYLSDLDIVLLDGSHIGTAQTGGSASITLSASEDIEEVEILGKEIFIMSGTGVNQGSFVTAYNVGTGVATVNPTWTTIPAANDTYMVVDTMKKLEAAPLWDTDNIYHAVTGEPINFAPITTNGASGYALYPAPYRLTGNPWGLRLRYYADLMALDLAGTVLAVLYKRWRNIWVQGVYAKCLQWSDDNRAGAEMTIYWNMIRQMVSKEKYGNEIPDMQCRVQDYD